MPSCCNAVACGSGPWPALHAGSSLACGGRPVPSKGGRGERPGCLRDCCRYADVGARRRT
eukprot:15430238-Alexandrium_andersonii.AAC.1